MGDILVIGGSSDLGKRIIKDVVSEGNSVTYTYNSNNPSSFFCSLDNSKIYGIKLDLTVSDDLLSLCDLIIKSNFSSVIYCAGHNPSKLAINMSFEEIDMTTQINFLVPLKIFTTYANFCISKKNDFTTMIFISSVAATKAKLGNSFYGSSKIGIERFLSNLALELARFNTKTLSISPSFIKTKMLTNYLDKTGGTLNELMKEIPTREILNPEDISMIVNLFISGKLKTTGTTLNLGNGEKVFI